MNTYVCRIDTEDIDQELVAQAGDIIKNGGLVAFPTETVYGLGGDAFNPESSKKIYAAKGRPSDNPLIVHIADVDKLDALVTNISESARLLIDRFWPGPLTIIFNKSTNVPYETTGGLETVAVRMPSDEIAREFIKAAGGYVAAPSANLSGKPSPTNGRFVVQDMDGRIDMILYGDDSRIGLESTIVDTTSDIPMILRPGYITKSMLEAVVGKVEVDKTILSDNSGQAPKAPGMKYRHYAPKGQLTIVAGDSEAVARYINENLADAKEKNLKTGVIATNQTCTKYDADLVLSAGDGASRTEVAHRLFTMLRTFDDENVDVIYSESFADDELGTAVMNRLLKAAGHRMVSLD